MQRTLTLGLILVAICGASAAWLVSAYPDLVADKRVDSPPGQQSAGAAPSGDRKSRDAAPVAVETATARFAKTSADIFAVGSLLSDESVQVASEIAGRIATITFAEGQAVKAGDVIVKLDEDLVRAEVSDAEARLRLAAQNNERTSTLSRSGIATARSRDEAISNLDTATAAAELARTRLSKHTLRAPFDGTVGVRNVSVGAFVSIGNPIVNIEKLDKLKVDFKLPELFLNDIKVGQPISIAVDATPGKVYAGEIYAIAPLVDINGRSLQVRARMPNPDLSLRPGLFARITIKGLTEREVTLVPEAAIVPREGEMIVFRVENGEAVENRVKLGDRKNSEVEIVEGLAPNATVIVAGQQKLRNRAKVDVIPTQPADATKTGTSNAAPPAATSTTIRGRT